MAGLVKLTPEQFVQRLQPLIGAIHNGRRITRIEYSRWELDNPVHAVIFHYIEAAEAKVLAIGANATVPTRAVWDNDTTARVFFMAGILPKSFVFSHVRSASFVSEFNME
jgi:hypothetical protein